MIDYWLVGCLIYPFLEVLLEIVLMRLSNEEKEKKEDKVNEEETLVPPNGAGRGKVSPLVLEVEAALPSRLVARARAASCLACCWMVPGQGQSVCFRIVKTIRE
jgi:hypothetical protein